MPVSFDMRSSLSATDNSPGLSPPPCHLTRTAAGCRDIAHRPARRGNGHWRPPATAFASPQRDVLGLAPAGLRAAPPRATVRSDLVRYRLRGPGRNSETLTPHPLLRARAG